MPTYAALVADLRAAGCVFAEQEAALLLGEGLQPADLDAAVRRRASGEPLEHIVGWVSFRGLRLLLDPGVFVPRRRTELIAREAERAAGAAGPAPVVLDLCCGVGAIGAAVLAAVPGAQLIAVDVDPREVACARRNLGDRVLTGDLFAPLPVALRGRIDVIAANAPYVPTAAIGLMPGEARDHEPALALDGGPDGLDIARRIAADAPAWLAPGGALIVETSRRQADALAALFAAAGLDPRIARDDDLDATAVIGRLRPADVVSGTAARRRTPPPPPRGRAPR